MIDETFGELEHNYNFFKYENVDFLGKEYKLRIVVESYDNTILDIQRENYNNYLKFIESNKEKIIKITQQYFLDVYGKIIDITKDITPTTVYFSKDGSWGILFDTDIDEENGFALFVQDGKIRVGTQDMFI